MNDDQARARGEHARRVLEDGPFHEAVKALHDGYLKKMLDLDDDNAEGLMECKRMISALTAVVGQLKSTMDSGKMAEARLANEKRKRK